jgi:tetratricopeptide (TPR) repeat protein
MDWSFVALMAPLFVVVGVLLSGDRPPAPTPPRNVFLALGVAFAALALVYALFAPWLADRRVDDSFNALIRRDFAGAVADARSARSFDPFSVDAVLAEASAEEAGGDNAAARALYRKATRIEPENPDTWFQLGAFELRVGRARAAYDALNHSYTLDRYSPVGYTCGLLDVARYRAFGVKPKGVTCPGLGRRAHP